MLLNGQFVCFVYITLKIYWFMYGDQRVIKVIPVANALDTNIAGSEFEFQLLLHSLLD